MLCLLLSAILLFAFSVTALAADDAIVYDGNAFPTFDRTEDEVMQAYRDAIYLNNGYDDLNRTTWFEEPSSLEAPYFKGVLKESTLEAMGSLMNFYRYLVGVEPAEYNHSNEAYLQAQALDRNFEFNHWISQDSRPEDMPQEIWDEGFEMNHIILAMGYTPRGSITGWLQGGGFSPIIKHAANGQPILTIRADGTKWRIWRRESGTLNWKSMGEFTDKTWQDETAVPDTMYQYTVQSISLVGDEYTSSQSIALSNPSSDIPSRLPKTTISNLYVEDGMARIICRKVEGDIWAAGGYRLVYKSESDSDWTTITSETNSFQHVIKNVGEKYTYRVWAISSEDASLNGTFSVAYSRVWYTSELEPAAPEKYSVNFDANGGSGAPAAQTAAGSITLPTTKPVRSGYTFTGWAKSFSATTPLYTAGETIVVTGDVTLYAVWEKTAYTITYYANGVIVEPADQKGAGSVTLSSTKPTRDGYIFKGWAKSASAAAADYQPGESITLSANLALYAVWEAIPSGGLKGDMTGDGKVNIFDVVRLLKYVTGESVTVYANPDVTGDTKENIFDVVRLLKFVTGESVEIH